MSLSPFTADYAQHPDPTLAALYALCAANPSTTDQNEHDEASDPESGDEA